MQLEPHGQPLDPMQYKNQQRNPTVVKNLVESCLATNSLQLASNQQSVFQHRHPSLSVFARAAQARVNRADCSLPSDIYTVLFEPNTFHHAPPATHPTNHNLDFNHPHAFAMVLNAYIPSFAARILDQYTETSSTETLTTTPTVTHTLAPSPTTTLPTPTTRTLPIPSRLFSTISPTICALGKEIAATARTTLALILGVALTLLILYTVCTAANLVLSRFNRGDTLGRMVARALGQWTAGMKTAWDEGWAVGASKNCDVRGAGPGVSWTSTQSEKFSLGQQEGRFFGGEMVGGKKEVEVVAVAKCEVSLGGKKGLEGSDMMEGGELVENHWGEGRK